MIFQAFTKLLENDWWRPLESRQEAVSFPHLVSRHFRLLERDVSFLQGLHDDLPGFAISPVDVSFLFWRHRCCCFFRLALVPRRDDVHDEERCGKWVQGSRNRISAITSPVSPESPNEFLSLEFLSRDGRQILSPTGQMTGISWKKSPEVTGQKFVPKSHLGTFFVLIPDSCQYRLDVFQ